MEAAPARRQNAGPVGSVRRLVGPSPRSQLGRAEARALAEAVGSGWVGTGVYARLFESRFAAFAGGERCAAVNSGTAALHLALEAAGARGGEVLLAPLDAVAAAHAVTLAGAEPVFCDVEPERGTLDPAAAQRALTPRTRAIVAVHLRGYPCDLAGLRALARRRRLALVEDCCQALRGAYRGRPLGTLGDAGAFSFGRHKTLTTEDGGALLYRRASWAARLDRLRRQGLSGDGPAAGPQALKEAGWRYRMNDLSAVLGLSQLSRWEGIAARLEAVRAAYAGALDGHPRLRLPAEAPGTRRGWSYFSVRAAGGRARALERHLRARGVAAAPWAPPAHLYEVHRPRRRRLPVAEAYWKDFVDLPFSAAMTAAETGRAADALKDFRG